MNNAEIAKRIGITTQINNSFGNYPIDGEYFVSILQKDGTVIHTAWYVDPSNYEYIINHLIHIGKLPNWMSILGVTSGLVGVIPELLDLIVNPVEYSLENIDFGVGKVSVK